MKNLLLILILFPLTIFSQTQIGADIDGEAAADQSGGQVSLSADGSILAIRAIENTGNGSKSGHVRVYKYISPNWVQLGADLDGEAENDLFGYKISLSSDGSVLAISALTNDGNGANSGHVRVYKYISPNWVQLGSDIDGEAADDWSGRDISLSSDGSILAIGANKNDGANGSNSGHVRVYKFETGNWTQLGADIDGEAADDQSGTGVDLSSDGTILAIGAQFNDGVNGANSGHVRVFKFETGNWTQLGTDIDGESAGDLFGSEEVLLSSDGSILAVTAIFNDGVNGANSGHVRVFKFETGNWIQQGSDIDGEAVDDRFGSGLSLSSDGSILAVGAYGNDDNGNDSGKVQIYKFISSNWVQQGADINGETVDDRSGISVSLSSSGNILAIGADLNDGVNGVDSGHVRVYDLNAVLSSDSFVLSNFEVYPNPTSNQFKIQLQEGLQLKKVNIYNQIGQFIKEETKSIIDVSKLSKGLYLVEIITNKGKATKKIVVE